MWTLEFVEQSEEREKLYGLIKVNFTKEQKLSGGQ
jgi:hypothetical protein